ncbi:heavy-metal-associated domain-containing protein [Geobacter sp. DSM 9736]|uniref:heavy-metal-associated domain-containing protein n=1 Tax=Geobacter sp. DSM 9736 TaxID=1277350 RepID=UPI000B503A93|nr:heavy-metal-associated domain-containing protein [Geobacter sp. DSM 9736]SNB45969.1 Copper chaperone CopZ [Geobacter sp. DSM 9736]
MKRFSLRLAALVLVISALGAGAVFALVKRTPPADTVVVLRTMGMTCGACAGKITDALEGKGGIASVQVEVGEGRVAVAYDSGAVKPEAIAERVTALGYGSSILQVLPSERYDAASAGASAGQSGCGCCNKNK